VDGSGGTGCAATTVAIGRLILLLLSCWGGRLSGGNVDAFNAAAREVVVVVENLDWHNSIDESR